MISQLCTINNAISQISVQKSTKDIKIINAPSDSVDNNIVRVVSVQIIGNRKTKERIITREIDLTEGSIYSIKELKNLIQLDKNKIFNTNLFNSVKSEITFLENDKNAVNVVFFVEERWYIWPSIIFKLADRNFSDWLFNQGGSINRFEYGVKFDQYNVRGLNEKLSAIGLFGFKKRFGFGYRIPYLTKQQKLGLNLSFDYNEYDQIDWINEGNKRVFITNEELYDNPDARNIISTSTDAYVQFSYRESFYNTHYLGLLYKNVSVNDSIAQLQPEYLGDGRTSSNMLSLSYRFIRDFTDRNSYPLNGFYINANLRKDGLGIFGDINQSSAKIQTAVFKELKHKFFYATSVSAFTSFPARQPYINREGLGFENNLLKGYELYVILSQHSIIHKQEFKKRLFEIEADLGKLMPLKQFRRIPLEGYFKIYFDHGYVSSPSSYGANQLFANRYIYSYGAGFDLVTYYDAVLRLEYSVNALNEGGFFINVKAGI